VKLLTYGAGPKIIWRRPKWDPWMHAILGGAHEFPRTAAGGKNGLGVELGGGADYPSVNIFSVVWKEITS